MPLARCCDSTTSRGGRTVGCGPCVEFLGDRVAVGVATGVAEPHHVQPRVRGVVPLAGRERHADVPRSRRGAGRFSRVAKAGDSGGRFAVLVEVHVFAIRPLAIGASADLRGCASDGEGYEVQLPRDVAAGAFAAGGFTAELWRGGHVARLPLLSEGLSIPHEGILYQPAEGACPGGTSVPTPPREVLPAVLRKNGIERVAGRDVGGSRAVPTSPTGAGRVALPSASSEGSTPQHLAIAAWWRKMAYHPERRLSRDADSWPFAARRGLATNREVLFHGRDVDRWLRIGWDCAGFGSTAPIRRRGGGVRVERHRSRERRLVRR